MASNATLSSEGFDLDALASAIPSSNNAEVIYELGGGVSIVENGCIDKNTTTQNEACSNSMKNNGNDHKVGTKIVDSPLLLAEEFKEKGNNAFSKHDWEVSYEMYSNAIRSVPYDADNSKSYRGEYLLKLKEEWEKEQYRIARKKLDEKDERGRLRRQEQRNTNIGTKTSTGVVEDNVDNDDNDNDNDDDDDSKKSEAPPEFKPPPHLYGENLAIYYSNRAAASLQLDQVNPTSTPNRADSTYSSYNDVDSGSDTKISNPRLESAVLDCTIAIYLNPLYTKALVRRATAYERLEQTDKALLDIRKAIEYMRRLNDTNNNQYKTAIQTERRLQKIEDERMEKLKTETLSKLKDLGNSILSNFGMSLDNFQAKQDPKTGGYSISFNNNPSSSGTSSSGGRP